MDKVLLVNNKIEELTKVAQFIEELGEEWGLPVPLVFSLNLVMEEALTNTISYGFEDDGSHTIEININKTGSLLTIIITDDGQEYDPTQKKDPDISLPAEERPIGGLGIFLIKKIMDSVHYKRMDNRNNLILTKNI
ncbi:MAG: ATP-binding protein [Bacteroidales bacterium]|jgi:serine/threonine-protein kinase RsbW